MKLFRETALNLICLNVIKTDGTADIEKIKSAISTLGKHDTVEFKSLNGNMNYDIDNVILYQSHVVAIPTYYEVTV